MLRFGHAYTLMLLSTLLEAFLGTEIAESAYGTLAPRKLVTGGIVAWHSEIAMIGSAASAYLSTFLKQKVLLPQTA